MKSNELIKGKWYTCKQWGDGGLLFFFEKKVKDTVFGYIYYSDGSIAPSKAKFTPYYYYEFIEVTPPAGVLKATPKRKRYEKKKVEELLGKFAEDLIKAFYDDSNFSIEKWKQDNL